MSASETTGTNETMGENMESAKLNSPIRFGPPEPANDADHNSPADQREHLESRN